jgi:hypothetical protein
LILGLGLGARWSTEGEGEGEDEGVISDSGSSVNRVGAKYSGVQPPLPLLDEPRGITRGESNVDALAVEAEDGPDLPSKSDSVLRGRGPSSALALLLDRRASERVPAAPIAFHPVGSSIGSHVLSASRISTARIWCGRSRARLDVSTSLSSAEDHGRVEKLTRRTVRDPAPRNHR